MCKCLTESLFGCLLNLINTIYGVVGLLLIAAGVLMKYGSHFIQDDFSDYLNAIPGLLSKMNIVSESDSTAPTPFIDVGPLLVNASIALLVLGAFLFVTSVIGCCGVCCKSKCLLIVYAVIICLIFVVQLILVAVFFTGIFSSQIKSILDDTLKDKYNGTDSSEVSSIFVNVIQLKWDCCGVENGGDYNFTKNWEKKRVKTTYGGGQRDVTLVIPPTCCKMEGKYPDIEPYDNTCIETPTTTNSYMYKGCWASLNAWLKKYKPHAIVVTGIVLLIQFFMVMSTSIMLCCMDRHEDKK